MISAVQLTYYPLGAQVMTLVLPLGFFIVVMAALYYVFTRPHTVPGRRPIGGARPVAPDPQTARDMSATMGFPTAPSGGGKAPLADRGTPPAHGVRTEEALNQAAEEAAAEAPAADDKVTGGSDQGQDAATESSEDQE
ncbi:MAG TPA: hypothetical protein VHT94_17505 [Streptosporangiaceae bacterium]|nr:hypothetical protein [Streptosporangiaceae bacterium]